MGRGNPSGGTWLQPLLILLNRPFADPYLNPSSESILVEVARSEPNNPIFTIPYVREWPSVNSGINPKQSGRQARNDTSNETSFTVVFNLFSFDGFATLVLILEAIVVFYI